MHYVYVLQALEEESVFYVGCTSDLKNRLASHNRGKNRSTKGHQWKLVYYEAYMSLGAARMREYRLKHDGRAKYGLLKRIRESLE